MKKLILLTIPFLSSCLGTLNDYTVKVTYCDNRPPKIFVIPAEDASDVTRIYTAHRAVPVWRNQLNVCEVEVIEVKPHTP